MFGLVIPGRLAQTEVMQDSPTSWIAQIERPVEVSNFAVFLTQQVPVPDAGVAVYASFVAPFQDWQFLGALANGRPSDIINVGWPFQPQVAQCQVAAIKLVIEPVPAILEKLQVSPPLDIRKELAKKTALNLFRYLESFNTGPQLQRALDQWFTRFEEKYARDPNFMLRSE